MTLRDGKLDLTQLRMASGEGRAVETSVAVESFMLGGVEYGCEPAMLPVKVALSRTVGDGWAFRLDFTARVVGPCSKCLGDAAREVTVEAREAHRPGGGEELLSPYLGDGELDLTGWVRDSLILALPASITCRDDCPGLCDTCGEPLALLGADHAHEKAPDPRWDALRNLGQ